MAIAFNGSKLRNFRRNKNLTQKQVAILSKSRGISISQNYLSQLERGTYKNPGAVIVAAIAGILEIDMTDLMT